VADTATGANLVATAATAKLTSPVPGRAASTTCSGPPTASSTVDRTRTTAPEPRSDGELLAPACRKVPHRLRTWSMMVRNSQLVQCTPASPFVGARARARARAADPALATHSVASCRADDPNRRSRWPAPPPPSGGDFSGPAPRIRTACRSPDRGTHGCGHRRSGAIAPCGKTASSKLSERQALLHQEWTPPARLLAIAVEMEGSLGATLRRGAAETAGQPKPTEATVALVLGS